MSKARTNEYFEGFVFGMESACKAAEYLEHVVAHYDPEKLASRSTKCMPSSMKRT